MKRRDLLKQAVAFAALASLGLLISSNGLKTKVICSPPPSV